MKRASALAAFVPAVLLGCSHQGAGSASRVPVTVAHAEQRPVPYEILATGTVEPRQTASVQAQVTGVLTRVAFREGDDVAAGEILFQIEARPVLAARHPAPAGRAPHPAPAPDSPPRAPRDPAPAPQDPVTPSAHQT